MLLSSIPAKFTIPWANSASTTYTRSIPTPSQIGVTTGAASLTDGFPPWCFQAGGAPDGRDFQGILQWVTQCAQYGQAGGFYQYDPVFSTAIGGYPKNALLASASVAGLFWVSIVDNNTTDPDTGGAGWSMFPGVRAIPFTTFYVSSTGNDANPGTSALPFATLGAAIAYISQFSAPAGVTINLSAGTFNGSSIGVISSGAFSTLIASWNIVGAGVGVTILSAPSTAINGGWAFSSNEATVTLSGMTLSGVTGCAYGNFAGTLNLTNCNFVAAASGATGALSQNGNVLFIRGACQYSGAFNSFWQSSSGGNLELSDINHAVTTLSFASGTTVSVAGAVCQQSQINVNASANLTFVNPSNVTGSKYNVSTYGIINTGGAGVNYLPGSTIGVAGGSPSFGAYL